MLNILYPIGYLICLLGLILWFYYQDRPEKSRLMSQVFLGGFFVYLLSLAFANGEVGYKLLILFRDFIILGLVSQFFNFFRKNKMLFFTMLLVLLGAFKFFGFEKMTNTFPPTTPGESPANSEAEPLFKLAPDGELLVQLQEAQDFAQLHRIIEAYQLSYHRAFSPVDADATDLDDYFIVNVPNHLVQDRLKALENDLLQSGVVEWVEENELIYLDPMEKVDHSSTSRNFGINDPEIGKLWGFEKMNIDQLYQMLSDTRIKPQRKARIYILDTGIDAQHEDIQDNYRSLHKKYDTDTQSHGTHCAGIAAAVSNNGKGVASFSTDNGFVEVSSIKVLNGFGGGTQQGIIKGMIEAADNGADVISMSLGGPSNRQKQTAYEKAVQYCNKKGAIVVVAAGNSQMDAKNYSPANVPGVITVAALDNQLDKASFSNTVNNLKMGISAPGVGVLSTIPNNKYAAYNGTSMATPYVAGLIGLLKSIYPKLDTPQAYQIIHSTGAETGNTTLTGKLIQPAKAVEALLD